MKRKVMNLYFNAVGYLRNEKGAQSLEWLGLAALLIMVLGFITAALDGGAGIKTIVSNILKSIGDQVGGGGGS